VQNSLAELQARGPVLQSERPAGRPALLGSGKAFVAIDRELDRAAAGPRWLEDERIAQCVADALQFGEWQLRLYDLRAWVLMVNHVHILIHPQATLAHHKGSQELFSTAGERAPRTRRSGFLAARILRSLGPEPEGAGKDCQVH